MTLIVSNRVKQITTTPPGSNPFALASTPATFVAFSSFMSIGDTTYYEADDGSSNYEVGLGTYTAANQLTRTTIYQSSNSGSPCNFTNNVTVICTAPAQKTALLVAAGIALGGYDGSALTNLSAAAIATGVLAAARGGAGTVNGILKANGSGVVSAATAGIDYVQNYNPSFAVQLQSTGGTLATVPVGTVNLPAIIVSNAAPPGTGTPLLIYCRY